MRMMCVRLWSCFPRVSPWVLVGVGLASGCGAGGAGAKHARGDDAQRDTKISHEECKLDSAAEKLDANADGKPDISIVKDGGRTICYAVDLNFDGKIDEWVYLDQAGKVRRREFALSSDPAVNEIEIYKDGQLAQVQKSTVLAGKLDTWQYYQAGRPVRAERDSNGDGRVDEWWVYQQGDKADCPMMYSDANGDGQPDPASEVNLCGGGYVPPERSGPHKVKSPSFERPGSLPTETEDKGAKADDKVPSPSPSAALAPAKPASSAKGK
jgi:hypothetical protein